MERHQKLFKTKCSQENYQKLLALNNPALFDFVGEYVQLCNPASVFVRSDSAEDAQYIRDKAKELGEEKQLNIDGHTVHFDGPTDQGRDKQNTKFLLSKSENLGSDINSIVREKGLSEIQALLKGIMSGKEMFVLFLCLGPVNSDFSIYAVQLTDSAYVAHSEDILYRSAYEAFKKKGAEIEFFKFVHSAGKLENSVSKNIDKRRVYIDLSENIAWTTNSQYAGNTVGLKKLALRLAINKASKENWLAEHMFVMGVGGAKNRKTYFTGAFPSACGKTSTCMVEEESIVGDDIAYLRKKNGKVFAVNVERGIFGIIRDVNPQNDPLIWQALTSPGEVIFSNVLVKDRIPYWLDDGKKHPENSTIFPHPNARYTIRLKTLKNCDPKLENPEGVEVKGIIYGGRDSDAWPSVFESFDWNHGVITIAASLESETTAATLGKQGVRKFNPMANLDFLSIPIRRYIQNHLQFVKDLAHPPTIFGVNYFLRDENGNYLSAIEDKRVWLKWMELRVHKEIEAIESPIGFLPRYEDLKRLFKQVLGKDYSERDYQKEFTLRIDANLAKVERIIEIYKTKIPDAPKILFEILEEQKRRLNAARRVNRPY
ncbi:MAG: phosphoenolpyruvate carboxykinase (GTP) [Candidatus Omnitrophica bacterium 4484_213]|nr:MAG: phosphoenolpyruvate carboxykinase (GTP) [Candidatus Omnitrophica bacterium 4484_213]